MEIFRMFQGMYNTFSEGGGIEVKIFSGLILLLPIVALVIVVYFLSKSTFRLTDGTMNSMEAITRNLSEGGKEVLTGVGNLLSTPHAYVGVLQTYADNAYEESQLELTDELGRSIRGDWKGNGANAAPTQLMDSMRSGGAAHALFTNPDKRQPLLEDPNTITVTPTPQKKQGMLGGGRRLLGGKNNG